jgi:hypothetical protein
MGGLIDELLQVLQQALSDLEGGTQGGDTSDGSSMPSESGASGGAVMPSGSPMPDSTMPGSTMPGSTMPGATMPGSMMPGSTGGAGQMTAQDSAATLSSYMSQNGINELTPNTLYSLSQNSNGNTPPEVSQAATYMLQNPSVYNQIETHDVSGADGQAGVNDLQWAAAGGLGAEGNSTGIAGGI